MRARAAALVLVSSGLAGCFEGNERSASFATYAVYFQSDLSRGGFLPADLVPHSARDIRVKRNIDNLEIEASFDFDPRDEEALIHPFLNFEQLRLRLAVAEGVAPSVVLASPQLLLRCGEGPMEFLQVTDHKHAKYWTSRDAARRATACTNNAVGSPSAG